MCEESTQHFLASGWVAAAFGGGPANLLERSRELTGVKED
jgi:hypothetical protein